MASVTQLIRNYARRYGVDPRAALAVARTEGGLRTGAVGDQGTSYGPFQLHRGGALPRGKGAAWANSPAGIEYAIRSMSQSGARGLTGRSAIEAIVRNFERPADPGSEIARALGFYGSAGAGGGGSAAGGSQAATGANIGSISDSGGDPAAFARALLNPRTSHDPMALLGAIKSVQAPGAMPSASSPPSEPRAAPGGGGNPLSFLKGLAGEYGLTVTSTTEGTHVPGSYHYKKRAVDYGGDSARMMRLMQYALKHPGEFREAFYDPAGVYIKNGKVYRGSIGGHSDHVHLAR